jgi:hypothetical protein
MFRLSRRANVVETFSEGKTFFQNFHVLKQKSPQPRRLQEVGAEVSARGGVDQAPKPPSMVRLAPVM